MNAVSSEFCLQITGWLHHCVNHRWMKHYTIQRSAQHARQASAAGGLPLASPQPSSIAVYSRCRVRCAAYTCCAVPFTAGSEVWLTAPAPPEMRGQCAVLEPECSLKFMPLRLTLQPVAQMGGDRSFWAFFWLRGECPGRRLWASSSFLSFVWWPSGLFYLSSVAWCFTRAPRLWSHSHGWIPSTCEPGVFLGLHWSHEHPAKTFCAAGYSCVISMAWDSSRPLPAHVTTIVYVYCDRLNCSYPFMTVSGFASSRARQGYFHIATVIYPFSTCLSST